MTVLDLPIEQVLEASLPDATDVTRAPDPAWLGAMTAFEVEGQIDGSEFQADLVYSTSGLTR